MKSHIMLATAAIFAAACVSSNGQGAILAEHSGFSDPTTEGFTTSGFGSAQVGGVTNDMGYDAWVTAFSSAGLSYSEPVGSLDTSDWTLSVTMRVVTPNVNPYGYLFQAGLTGGIGLLFGSDSSGNQLVVVPGVEEFTLSGGSTYNNYELVYDSAAGAASFWIDGTERLSGITTQPPSSTGLTWGGAYQSPTLYQANWNLVSLEVVPEPSSVSLVLLCIGILYFGRRWVTPKDAA